MDIDFEIAQYNVSRETIAKLKQFVSILQEWNGKMNLVSKSSLQNVWSRHVLDSLQLLDYIPQNAQKLVDIGSGSGFPGVVLAIALQEKIPTLQIKLVESINKKTLYLKDVCARLNLTNTQVINTRVETSGLSDVDVITARAVAALDVLCGYQAKMQNISSLGLYLKGKTYAQEVATARDKWQFDLSVFCNKYSEDGVVLTLKNLRGKR